MPDWSRRRFLAASGAAFAAGWPAARAADPPRLLTAGRRSIEVRGRAASVYGLLDRDGARGLAFAQGERFAVRLANALAEDTLIHWHGLAAPAAQDGVAGPAHPPLSPGATRDYDFALPRAGTFWMHAHHGLQEQKLLAAPLIVRDPADSGRDEQEVVVMLHDFSFREPAELLLGLQLGTRGHQAAAAAPEPALTPVPDAHIHGGAPMTPAPAPVPAAAVAAAAPCCTVPEGGGLHLNDLEFDAYLANDRALDDPEVVRVEAGGRIRLRIVNAAAATNFWIELGALEGELIAVDGNAVRPLRGRRFPIATAQRLDLRLALPAGAGAYPVLAEREGDTARTGIVLATRGAAVRRLAERAAQATDALDLALDLRLVAREPLPPRTPDRRHVLRLVGDHDFYRWGLDLMGAADARAVPVRLGERVEIAFSNATGMAHPMHLHGHRVQLVAVDGRRFAGPLRDTVLVPPAAAVTVAFDADNPGDWAFHCHHLYHMAAGMMTTLAYSA